MERADAITVSNLVTSVTVAEINLSILHVQW